jgi:hypothetical protein
MSWKLWDLTVDLLSQSVKALSNPPNPFTHFNPIITILSPTLNEWLTAAQSDPAAFSVQAFPYSSLVPHFPDIISGGMPLSISCSTMFSALMDMRYLYGWRLFIDKLLSGILDADSRFFRLFLSRAASCLHSGTYVGVELLPELTPNMCLHFISAGGWPTGNAPFHDFCRPEITSSIAQRYNSIAIEVHSDRPAPSLETKLITAADASARQHH